MEARYQQLNEQTRAALREREAITKRLLEERRLRQAIRELEEAQLVAALIDGTEAEPVADIHPSWATKQSSGVQQAQGLDA